MKISKKELYSLILEEIEALEKSKDLASNVLKQNAKSRTNIEKSKTKKEKLVKKQKAYDREDTNSDMKPLQGPGSTTGEKEIKGFPYDD